LNFQTCPFWFSQLIRRGSPWSLDFLRGEVERPLLEAPGERGGDSGGDMGGELKFDPGGEIGANDMGLLAPKEGGEATEGERGQNPGGAT
jgi:hypothetical protein